MRPVRSLLIYVLSVFLLGPLIAPWIYRAAQWVAGQFPQLDELANAPFHRYVNRCMLGVALLGLRPFLRSLGANSWETVGLVNPAGEWPKLSHGFLLGFCSLAAVAALPVVADARVVDDTSAAILTRKLAAIGASAFIVAIVEELLFRGALFVALRRAHNWVFALSLSSAFYALLHFFQKVKSPPEVTWTSGFAQLAGMMEGFMHFRMLIPGFVTLTLAGVILGLAFQRTGNLYFSIGLHAGWIFWLKSYNVLTDSASSAKEWFWGSAKLYDGWLALVVLTITFTLVWALPEPVPRKK